MRLQKRIDRDGLIVIEREREIERKIRINSTNKFWQREKCVQTVNTAEKKIVYANF